MHVVPERLSRVCHHFVIEQTTMYLPTPTYMIRMVKPYRLAR